MENNQIEFFEEIAMRESTWKVLIAMKRCIGYLGKHMGISHDLYMKGTLAKGAFNYILSRYDNVYFVINSLDLKRRGALVQDIIKFTEEDFLRTCALASIDLSIYLEHDVLQKDRTLCYSRISKLNDALKNAGLTDKHVIFGYPVKPEKNLQHC